MEALERLGKESPEGDWVDIKDEMISVPIVKSHQKGQGRRVSLFQIRGSVCVGCV